VRVTTAFSRLLNLTGVWVRQVQFEPGRVVVEVALERRRLLCPLCEYSTASRKDKRPVDSVWRHLDLGVWRLEESLPPQATVVPAARGAYRGCSVRPAGLGVHARLRGRSEPVKLGETDGTRI